MIHIRLNVAREYQDHPDVLAKAQTMAMLFNSDWFNQARKTTICLHEGVHLLFSRKCGFEQPELYGPGVEYNPVTGKVNAHDSMVESITVKTAMEADPILLAQYFLAPMYVEEKLLNHRTREQIKQTASGDRALFHEWRSMREERKHDIPFPWPSIRDVVRKQLRSPAFRKEIWNCAHEFEHRVFGPGGRAEKLKPGEVGIGVIRIAA